MDGHNGSGDGGAAPQRQGPWRSAEQRRIVIEVLGFTPAQARVLDQVMLEKTDKEVAEALGRKVSTVHTHLRTMCRICKASGPDGERGAGAGCRTVKGLLVRVLRVCNEVG